MPSFIAWVLDFGVLALLRCRANNFAFNSFCLELLSMQIIAFLSQTMQNLLIRFSCLFMHCIGFYTGYYTALCKRVIDNFLDFELSTFFSQTLLGKLSCKREWCSSPLHWFGSESVAVTLQWQNMVLFLTSSRTVLKTTFPCSSRCVIECSRAAKRLSNVSSLSLRCASVSFSCLRSRFSESHLTTTRATGCAVCVDVSRC